jgi:hypothetical protein
VIIPAEEWRKLNFDEIVGSIEVGIKVLEHRTVEMTDSEALRLLMAGRMLIEMGERHFLANLGIYKHV